MTGHGRVTDYLDGTLAPEEEAALLDHLGECEECQAALHAEMQRRDREEAARDAEARAAGGGAATDAEHAQHAQHGRAGEYLDGALDAAGETAFLAHVGVCAECQRDLHGEVQLRDREDALREAARMERSKRESAEVIPIGRGRRRAPWIAAGAAVMAAAAALVVVPRLFEAPPATPPPAPAVLALAPARAIEVRLSYGAAAKHRPYDTMRSGTGPAAEPIAPAVVAQLDRAGDCHGVGTAYVLAGEHVRADEQLRRCPASPALDADRAGLAVLRGQPAEALELTEHALDAAPDHAVALWNRALALRALGLDLSAAAAFARIAELEGSRDPAWAGEAAERAQTTSAELDRMKAAFDEVVRAGRAMVQGGPPLDAAPARRVPSRARVMLHDALRTATTPARLDELAPLAATLEGLAGTGLARYVAEARARLSPQRTAASEGYQQLIANPSAVDDPAWERWLALATRARADDLILGARIATNRLDGAPSADALAAATRDPWFELAVALARARAALEGGRLEESAARLAALAAHCPAAAVSYRCLIHALASTEIALDRHRPAEAKVLTRAALAMARQLGEWPQHAQALTWAGDAERFGGIFSTALAYYDEAARAREPCDARNVTFTVADMLLQQHRPTQARAAVATAHACDQTPSPGELSTLVRLLRAGHAAVDRAALLAKIDEAKRDPRFARDAAYFDFLAAWLDLGDDPASRERLAGLRAAARDIPGANRDKTLLNIDSVLYTDAARRAAWADALATASRWHGVAPPGRCALVIGGDEEFRFAAIAVGPDGALTGHYEPDLPRGAEWLAPAPMRRALAACDDVAVLALPPWLGIGPVLDAATPWRYVLGAPRVPAAARRRHVVIADPAPPPSAGLAPLAQRVWPPPPAGPDELLTGAAATPERALAAMADATLVEVHGHATWLDRLDAPVLALSPGAEGWSLGAARIRAARLTHAPVVVLADCAGGVSARFEHEAWGLPSAFRTAGASAVIASLAEIPDRDAAVFFGAVTVELARGTSPAAAVARARADKLRGDPTSWVRHVVVFQ